MTPQEPEAAQRASRSPAASPQATAISELQSENERLKEKINAQQPNAAAKDEATHFVSNSIADMLLKFYSATTVEERAKYVMDPQRVLPLMRNYYKDGITPLNKFERVSGDAETIGSGLYYLRADNPDEFYIIVKAEVLEDNDESYFFLTSSLHTPKFFIE